MATQTDHMKLTKPAYTDSADIAVINSNMDAIDTATSKILPVISGTTNNSGYTIASGEYFEANGKLYKANASIPTNQAWSSSATEQSDHGAINALNGKIGKLDGSTAYVSGIDANSYTTSGVYHVGITSNSPTGSTVYGILEVEAVNGDRITQRFTNGSGILYSRQRYNSSQWSSWNELALKSDIASIGTTTEGTNTTSSVSVPNNTATKISTITLTSGTYILIACVDWASGETGYRQVSTASPTNPGRRVAVTSVPAPGTNKQTYQQLIEIVSISGSESIDIYGIQTSGAALNAYPYVYAVKIK